jgi:hypothetical protein
MAEETDQEHGAPASRAGVDPTAAALERRPSCGVPIKRRCIQTCPCYLDREPGRRPFRDSGLKPSSKKFDCNKSDESGIDGDNKVCDGENIYEGKRQGFSVHTVGAGKFSHQKIRIVQENDEPHFDHHAPEWCEPFHDISPLTIQI